MQDTLHALLLGPAAAAPADAPAIGAPGRPDLTHGGLRALIERTLATLDSLGIGRNDRVAIVLANGPEMAACFIAAACGVATAPLNPAYRADEFEFYLSDLNAKALVVEHDSTSPAIEVAQRLGIRRLDLHAGERAGEFTLVPHDGQLAAQGSAAPAAAGGLAAPGDVSMLLHTSGTTSRPKIVPLSQRNLAASASTSRARCVHAADCGLNIMPLFHIHGLIAGVLAPLAAGSQVFCTPGFNALKFFGWMDEAAPTWYTAVPTMHQAIVARASKNPTSSAATRCASCAAVELDAAAGDRRAGGCLRRAADRGLRHDRGRAPDGQQPAAAGACASPAAWAWPPGPSGDHGRGRQPAAAPARWARS
jgi:acyl-CoA synthetase (AMP-forming)/AMP-acid ligase II